MEEIKRVWEKKYTRGKIAKGKYKKEKDRWEWMRGKAKKTVQKKKEGKRKEQMVETLKQKEENTEEREEIKGILVTGQARGGEWGCRWEDDDKY